ncbi:hypothetical protein QBC46DRAFT_392642 [Diplogelasinospora grovesii]|uniref:BTB domain-containing protein n=1 Tax=Diplogelasinospora grovesii TaxID=303347 RepID=A0AAN6S2H4_9PEZI|nr:hypothetical protein QBC46DRAFT_392642 [Diplogelasinospora grovesii]
MASSEMIAPAGDVVLVIGPEKKRFRVHSLLLCAASPVFRVMLDNQFFQEGGARSPEAPKNVALPEDDAEALEIILNVLHYRADEVDDPLAPASVLRVAIATDKYDLTPSLKLVIRDWLKCDGVTDATELWQLAIAACWLGNDIAFEAITRSLLQRYGGSFIKLGETDRMPPDVRVRLPALMEERRGQLRLDLLSRFYRAGTNKDYGCLSCNWFEVRSMDYLGYFLSENNFDPWSKRCIGWKDGKLEPNIVSQISIESAIASVNAESIEVSSVTCNKPHKDPGFKGKVQEAIREYRNSIHGLCLECVRTGDEHESHSDEGH